MNLHEENEGWRRFEYSATDGLRLAARDYGDRLLPATPVICLAGLTRNSADFHGLALHLSRDAKTPRRVFCPDYRGRGMSAHDPDWRNYDPLTEAGDVVAGAVAAGIKHAFVIGTSRGGLIALTLAAIRPALLRGVIFNDIAPEIEGQGLVRIKSYVSKGGDHANWSSAVAALKAIGESQFPIYTPADWERQARLIFEERDGKIARRYDPALMKGLAEINLDQKLPTLWPQFTGLAHLPLMLIRGDKTDLISMETVARMQEISPQLQLVRVPGQGHAPDLATKGLPQEIANFIAKAEKARK